MFLIQLKRKISSEIFPHLEYIKTVLKKEEINDLLNLLKNLNCYDLILSMHPSQIVNLGSPNETVVKNSIIELENHYLIFTYLNTETKEINIHLGGTYNNKEEAKKRFIDVAKNLIFLKYLTIENDEISYTIEDCLEVSEILNIPVVFDIHHHKCHLLNTEYKSKYNNIKEIILECYKTWNRVGYKHIRLHISSPKDGYTTQTKSRPHSDFINIDDFPKELLIDNNFNFLICIDVEAKYKEIAIKHLLNDIKNL